MLIHSPTTVHQIIFFAQIVFFLNGGLAVGLKASCVLIIRSTINFQLVDQVDLGGI